RPTSSGGHTGTHRPARAISHFRDGFVDRLVKLRGKLACRGENADIGSPKLHGHMYPRLCPTRAQQRPTAVLPWASLPPQPFTGLIHAHGRALAVGGFFFIPYAGSRNLFGPILALLPILGLEPVSNSQMVSNHGEQLVCGVPVRIVTQKGTMQGGTLNVLAIRHIQGHLIRCFTPQPHVGQPDPVEPPQIAYYSVLVFADQVDQCDYFSAPTARKILLMNASRLSPVTRPESVRWDSLNLSHCSLPMILRITRIIMAEFCSGSA